MGFGLSVSWGRNLMPSCQLRSAPSLPDYVKKKMRTSTVPYQMVLTWTTFAVTSLGDCTISGVSTFELKFF